MKRVIIYIEDRDIRQFQEYMSECPVDGNMFVEDADE